MTAFDKTLAEINEEALRVLSREIGLANTLRFLNQYSKGYGNYVEEREKLFGTATLDGIVAEIRKPKP